MIRFELFKEIFRIDPDAAKNARFLVGSYLVIKTAIYATVESTPILGNNPGILGSANSFRIPHINHLNDREHLRLIYNDFVRHRAEFRGSSQTCTRPTHYALSPSLSGRSLPTIYRDRRLSVIRRWAGSRYFFLRSEVSGEAPECSAFRRGHWRMVRAVSPIRGYLSPGSRRGRSSLPHRGCMGYSYQ